MSIEVFAEIKMKKNKIIFIYLLPLILWANIISGSSVYEPEPETIFLTIGSGGVTGIYFPAGLTISKMINDRRSEYGLRASVESTPGSVFNVNAVMAGYLEFGLVQSDKQYQAFKGLSDWSKKGPQKDLRSVFSIHSESVCLVAAGDTDIKNIDDLRGKRVNLGSPGAAMYMNAVDTLKAAGLNPESDISPREFNYTDAPRLMQDYIIDAFFCTVGHPNEMIMEAASGSRGIRFIPVDGPAIDRIVSKNKFYRKTVIPVSKFYGNAEGPANVETYGVVATLCTSVQVPEDVVYTFTKIVFENFDYFKKQHPAFEELTRDGMLKGLSAPIHPGALKYYSENGLIP